MSIAPGFIRVQAIDHLYPSMEMCTNGAAYITNELINTKPSPESTVSAYCTEIPKKA